MIKKHSRYFLVVLIGFLLAGPFVAFCATEDFSLSPLIVDEKAKQRDILKQTAVITNNTEHKLTLYVTVKNMDIAEGEQAFEHRTQAEIETSIANWFEITRGVIELEPGETKRIPYLIQVHLNAQPGVYHAKMFFQEGSNRDEAESRIKPWKDIDVNLEILDDAKERLQLGSFSSDKVFFTGNTASFSYLLENIGNRAVAPRGEIRIFNRRGEEVGTLPANTAATSLLPEATSQLGAVWDAAGKFGRYKAYLDIEYGDKQMGTVNDTVFFWVIPWKQILFIFVGLAVVMAFCGYLLYDRYGFGRKPVLEQSLYQDAFSSKPATSFHRSEASETPVFVARAVARPEPALARQPVVMRERLAQVSFAGQPVRLQPRQKEGRPEGAVVSLRKR